MAMVLALCMVMIGLRNDNRGEVHPGKMLAFIITVFVIVIIAAAFTPVLRTQINTWRGSLNASSNTGASTIVSLIPLILWILVAVGIILGAVATFMPHEGSL